jgi:hypothetical protein
MGITRPNQLFLYPNAVGSGSTILSPVQTRRLAEHGKIDPRSLIERMSSIVTPLRPMDEVHPQAGDDEQGFMAVSKLPITEEDTSNAAGTARAITMHLPAESRQSSTFGSQTLHFENEVPEIRFKSQELMALLIDDTMTSQQKFITIMEKPKHYGLSSAIIIALEQDVIRRDQSDFFTKNSAQAQLAKASQIITRLNSSPLQLIMSLDNLNPENKLKWIKDGAIVDQKFLDTLPQDAAEAVALIQQKMIYKPISDTMEAKDLTLERKFSPNPNSPSGERIISELTIKYGSLPEITVKWEIPKGARSAEEIREAMMRLDTRNTSNPDNKYSLDLAKAFRAFTAELSRPELEETEDDRLSASLSRRLAETNPEAAQKEILGVLDPLFNKIIESRLTTLNKEQLIEQFFAKLSEGLKIEESTAHTKYGEMYIAFSKGLKKDDISARMKEAMISVIRENLAQAEISEILNPSNYPSHEEYTEAVENKKHLGPEMLSDQDLQEKYQGLMQAGFGKNHNDADIPESQLVTQTITVNTADKTKLEFLPNKEVTGKEVKMPGGVVVHTAGAAPKGNPYETFSLRSDNGRFKLEINNGIISLFGPNKEGQEKLTAQINPSGVTLLFDENNKNTRPTFTLPTANRPGTFRAQEHFASSSRKFKQALSGKKGFVPQNIRNDGMIRAALSPYGGALIFRPNGTFGTDFHPNGDILRYPEAIGPKSTNQFSNPKKVIL